MSNDDLRDLAQLLIYAWLNRIGAAYFRALHKFEFDASDENMQIAGLKLTGKFVVTIEHVADPE